MRIAYALVLILAVAAVRSDADPQAGEPEVGKAHPEIRLPTIDRKQTVGLEALRGKKVLLLQFASW